MARKTKKEKVNEIERQLKELEDKKRKMILDIHKEVGKVFFDELQIENAEEAKMFVKHINKKYPELLELDFDELEKLENEDQADLNDSNSPDMNSFENPEIKENAKAI
ncbi:hypothetical protein MKY91_20310 [Alkalicoccobacillus gibsonii]|uniref:Uncharacterized protein n=1 Tax=Alkalicoccobacillus gibsonii TaxID=79881 RepID=A0ABU9VNN4_9BACI